MFVFASLSYIFQHFKFILHFLLYYTQMVLLDISVLKNHLWSFGHKLKEHVSTKVLFIFKSL
jgi:hypothetical protein